MQVSVLAILTLQSPFHIIWRARYLIVVNTSLVHKCVVPSVKHYLLNNISSKWILMLSVLYCPFYLNNKFEPTFFLPKVSKIWGPFWKFIWRWQFHTSCSAVKLWLQESRLRDWFNSTISRVLPRCLKTFSLRFVAKSDRATDTEHHTWKIKRGRQKSRKLRWRSQPFVIHHLPGKGEPNNKHRLFR